MKSNIFKLLAVAAFASSAVFIASCGSNGDKTAFADFHPEKEIDKYIDGYFNASLGDLSNPKSGKSAVYIDFSDGLSQAYTSNTKNVDIIKAITNKIVDPSIEWFAVNNGEINPLQYTSNDLYNKVSNPKEYGGIMAPIEETLKKITDSNNDALFVTDFEEYSSNGIEEMRSYQKEYFVNWLSKGNSITFFYTVYDEVNSKTKLKSKKHLYFTVFTQGAEDDNSMVSKIKEVIEVGGFDNIVKNFTLNNNPYAVSNNYGGKDLTGFMNKQFNQWKNYNSNACLDKKRPYEVIGINKAWNEDVDKYVKNIIDKENGNFMGKLYLNASDQSCFKLNKVSVKVYDVTEDYVFFAQCQKAKDNLPKMTKDKGKNDVWTKESKKNAVTSTCYVKDKMELKPEWSYSKANSKVLESWDEVFAYDENIFSSHLKNDNTKIELITVFHENYKLKNVKNQNALLRIDFVIEEAAFNNGNPVFEDFIWTSTTKSGIMNESLYQSIKLTLQENKISPRGKILYSYYIKLANSKDTE